MVSWLLCLSPCREMDLVEVGKNTGPLSKLKAYMLCLLQHAGELELCSRLSRRMLFVWKLHSVSHPTALAVEQLTN